MPLGVAKRKHCLKKKKERKKFCGYVVAMGDGSTVTSMYFMPLNVRLKNGQEDEVYITGILPQF